jgi:radical SAM family uncharacterized protein
MLQEKLEQVLSLVEKPARYVNNEYNSVHKVWEECNVRMVFAYPDVYEIGMSHLGLEILYGVVNSREGMLMERAFAPWRDMEEKMRVKGLPLFSLESKRPVRDFDLLGFTLQYELSFTNILNMLDLAGIPLHFWERGPGDPLVIAGGPCAFNPEPLAPFFDFFLIGDGEEGLVGIMELVAEHKEKNSGRVVREEFLEEVLNLPGIYVPSFYHFKYAPDGTVVEKKVAAPAPGRIKKNVLKNFEKVYYPERPIVPNMETVHDRIMLEVARGCARGCRFCQAGIIYRPVREKSKDVLVRQAEKLAESTGYPEISLVSLSSADYSSIVPLARELADKMSSKGVSLSLPSLRVDKFSVDLADEIQKVRKSTLTFAPEAGTQRLRDVINKGVTEEDVLAAVSSAFSAGWDKVKLYFMMGLPTETYEDLDGIFDLALKVFNTGRDIRGGKGRNRIKVTVSVSSFVPKAHTPFQWCPQDTVEVLKSKQAYLKDKFGRIKGLDFNWHDAQQSFLEAVIARGNRELAPVIREAWRKGCRFDSWSDQFKPELWREAFEAVGYDPTSKVNFQLNLESVLPWEHIDTGVSREFLLREYRNALQGKLTLDCRQGKCSQCGICIGLGVGMELRGEENAGQV